MKTKSWLPINADLIGIEGGVERVTTPALIVDLQALQTNVRTMATQCAAAGLKLRPHAKTHKSADIAQMQMAAGAAGLCCATPHEVITMAAAGVKSILLTSPTVQSRHFKELARLHDAGLELMVVADHLTQLRHWSNVLASTKRPLPVLVDIDVGMKRTGVASSADAVALARELSGTATLQYVGVQAYSGMIQHINAYAERHRVYSQQLDRLQTIVDALTQAGLKPGIISGGGTGSFAIDAERGLYTESQAGSYIFMDVEYNAVELFPGRSNPYLTSLFLRTSVVSANAPGQVTINAGFKSFATDGPLAKLIGDEHAHNRYELFGDEYGRVVIDEGLPQPALGDYIDLITPHCDPTVNLHDCYHVIDVGKIVDIWPIVARGTL